MVRLRHPSYLSEMDVEPAAVPFFPEYEVIEPDPEPDGAGPTPPAEETPTTTPPAAPRRGEQSKES